MRRVLFWIRLCFLLSAMKIKSEMNYYRSSYFFGVLVHIMGYFSQYVVIWVILKKFQYINGWNLFEVIFLYSLNLLSYSIAQVFVAGTFWDLDTKMLNGELDEVMIRPMDPLFLLISKNIITMYISHITLSIYFLYFSAQHLSIAWTASNIMWLSTVLIGAILIQASITVIVSCTAFWTVKSRNLVGLCIWEIRGFVQYPLSIYNYFIQAIFTFVIPYAFVNFYPVYYLFDKREPVAFNIRFQYSTIMVGIIMVFIARAIWKKGIQRYQSIGA